MDDPRPVPQHPSGRGVSGSRVLLVDEDGDWRMLAELHLQLTDRFELVGSLESLPAAMDALDTLRPDLVLVGLGRPSEVVRDDIALLAMLAPSTPIVLASAGGPRAHGSWTSRLATHHLDKMAILELVGELDRVRVLAG